MELIGWLLITERAECAQRQAGPPERICMIDAFFTRLISRACQLVRSAEKKTYTVPDDKWKVVEMWSLKY